MPAQLVHDLLTQAAVRWPNKTALVTRQGRFDYATLDAMSNRLARALQELGVRRGDRVVVQLANSTELVVALFAVLKAGAVFVILNPTTKRDKLVHIVQHCQAAVLVLDAASAATSDLSSRSRPDLSSVRGLVVAPRLAPELRADSIPALDYDAIQATHPDGPLDRANIDRDLACLIYTSGTTGEPKGVMSDHDNVLFATRAILEYLGTRESDIILNVLPLSFDYGLYQIFMAFERGATLVLEKSFAYPAAILKRIEQERVTGFPGVPTLFSMLLRLDPGAFDLSSLRFLTNTAAALPERHLLELRKRFPQATLFSMYGLTETKRTLYLPPEELDRRPGSVGIPIPGTEAWLEDDSGRRLPHGHVGELVVRGRHVMRGYWNDPQASADRFPPAALGGERHCRTGDLFRTDADGFFYFVGRKDNMIKSRGEKVAPKEVENVLYQLPDIVEAAVVGVADPILGQAIKAYVVTADPRLTASRILSHCKDRLEDFMVPKEVEFVAELPKTLTGKIATANLK